MLACTATHHDLHPREESADEPLVAPSASTGEEYAAILNWQSAACLASLMAGVK
jgi:hypothetical protein